MNAKEVLAYAKKNEVVMVDLRFTDWPGTWQHCSYPISQIEEGTFEDGMGFDGSSIRGWQAINESDMLMVPDPSTAFIDPFFEHRAAEPTLAEGRCRECDEEGLPGIKGLRHGQFIQGG